MARGKKTNLKKENMELTNYEIEGIDPKDYPDFTDAYLAYAEDINGNELTGNQLEDWQEKNQTQFYEMIIEEFNL
tara:strand:- start:697 stop:921 length:225 start_codon:yes stop_codon:yes gene_type:complete